jgi:hypothetical protein
MQQKKSICSEKKRHAAEKIDAFQKKSLCGKKNRCALKKIVMQPKKSICSEKNRRAAKKIDVQQELVSMKHEKNINRQLNSKGGQKWLKQTKPLKITFTGKA